jgi:hypothetical protein
MVGMAIFHAEGSKLDRWLTNAAVVACREGIERVELHALGLSNVELHRPLYRILEAERRLLWQVRQSHLRASFGNAVTHNA